VEVIHFSTFFAMIVMINRCPILGANTSIPIVGIFLIGAKGGLI